MGVAEDFLKDYETVKTVKIWWRKKGKKRFNISKQSIRKGLNVDEELQWIVQRLAENEDIDGNITGDIEVKTSKTGVIRYFHIYVHVELKYRAEEEERTKTGRRKKEQKKQKE